MKQKIYIFGLITNLVIFTGTLFKINHLPGAGILLTIGIGTLVLFFIPIALLNSYKADKIKQNLPLYIITFITCLFVFTAMLFKIQHWPYAGILLVIALPFPYVVFLPVFLIVTSKNKNFNIYNVVFVLSLLALNSVFSALLALNVSKTRIEDSYNISRNYNQLEKALNQLTVNKFKSPIDLKIDEAIKIVNDYQDIILKAEGISRDQWETNPGNLWRPDSRAVAAQILLDSGDRPFGIRLSKSLKGLIGEMGNTPEYKNLAKGATGIFDFGNSEEYDQVWAEKIFQNNNLAWSLIYLDGLETNLYMIRASVK